MFNYLLDHDISQSNIRNQLIFIYSYASKFRNFLVFLKLSYDKTSNAKRGKKISNQLADDVLFKKYFYMRIIVVITPTNSVTNSFLPCYFAFVKIENKNQFFSNLVLSNSFSNISYFCLQRVALYFKGTQNSRYLYKEILLLNVIL